MAEDKPTLPPQLQEQLMRLQQLQQTLRSVLTQRQQLEMELSETEKALSELERSTDDAVIYKSVGSILVKSPRQGVMDELKEHRDVLKTRVDVLMRQEKRSREKIDEMQKRLQEMLKH